jgi:hypothetical protein
MKRQEVFSVFITFLVGFFVGGYFYLTNAAGFIAKLTTPSVEQVSEFIVIGEVYGGCRSACPSFRVADDGSYRYLYTPSAGADQVVRQGALPRSLVRELRTVLTDRGLKRESRIIEPAFCNSYTDGIDVFYRITLDSATYTLDSCGTAVTADGQLWTTLGKVWTYFETGGNN